MEPLRAIAGYVTSLVPFPTPSPDLGFFDKIRKTLISSTEQPRPLSSFNIYEATKQTMAVVSIGMIGFLSFYVVRFIRHSIEEALESPPDSPSKAEVLSQSNSNPIIKTPAPLEESEQESTTKKSPTKSVPLEESEQESTTKKSPTKPVPLEESEQGSTTKKSPTKPVPLEESEQESTTKKSPPASKPPERFPISSEQLFNELLRETVKPEYLKPEEVSSRFKEKACVKSTVLPFTNKEGKFLYANLIGEGISNRQFIITQAPQDELLFWQMAKEKGSFILDLIQRAEIIGTYDLEEVGTYYPVITFGRAEKRKYLIDEGKNLEINITSHKKFTDQKTGKTLDECFLDTYWIHTTCPRPPKAIGVVYVSEKQTSPPVNELIQVSEKQISKKQISPPANELIQILHYRNWLPRMPISFLELDILVRTLEEKGFDNPGKYPIVICREGNAKSAFFIVAFIIKEQINKRIINRTNFEAKLKEIILRLRQQAGETFISSQELLHLLRGYGKYALGQITPS